MITASYLFSKEKYEKGDEKCFYCGLPCGTKYGKKDYVKKTFTNRDIVKYPCSDYVCGCCIESLRTGGDDIVLIDGDIKTGRSASPRMYSWILTGKENYGFTKKHLDFCREKLLNPPEPPFSIILSDSGQKQLIFRSQVNYDRDFYSVQLEDKQIDVEKSLLKEYLDKAILICAAIGKKSLSEPDRFNNYKNCIEVYGSESPLVEWLEIYSSPLGELAAWICPGKEECKNDNIVSGRISEKVSRDCRQEQEPAGNGRTGNKGRDNQILFNFA